MHRLINKALKFVAGCVGCVALTTHAQPEAIAISRAFDLTGRTETALPGIQLRVHQANETLLNTVTERENVLTGNRPDFLGFPLENFANEASAQNVDWVLGHTYFVEGPVDFDQGGAAAGELQQEQMIPGIPGLEGGTDNITTEMRMLIEIPHPGLFRFGIHASGGFTVHTGNLQDVFQTISVAAVEGHQEATTTRFDLAFEAAGIYPFRVLWYTGEGNASFEWWSLNTDEEAFLLNTEGGLQTYRDIPTTSTSITAVSPQPGAEGVLLNQDSVVIEILEGQPTFDPAHVSTTLNGESVPNVLSSANNRTLVTIALPDLIPFRTYEWSLEILIDARPRVVTGTFTTTVFGADGILFVEAEDFNFGKGLWDQFNPIGLTGAYPGGAYRNRGTGVNITDPAAGSDFGVDYFETSNANDSTGVPYRPGTGVETVERLRTEDAYRGTFSVVSNHAVTGTQGGDWMNYTRNFPLAEDGSKITYQVYARVASGEEPIHLGLDRVTSDPLVPEQETEPLAELRLEQSTGGRDVFDLSPMQAPGEPGVLAEVDLGGVETIRLNTMPDASQDIDYLILIPAIATQEPGAILSFSRDGNQLVIEYTGILMQAEILTGEYTVVEGATSPYTVTPDQSQSFFMAK